MLSTKHWNGTQGGSRKRIGCTLPYLKTFHRVSVRALFTGCLILASVLLIFSFTAAADVTHVTSADGITVSFKLPQLQVTQVTPDASLRNTAVHGADDTVRYSECDWIQEPGYPRLPVTRVLLAIPSDVQLRNADISVNTGTLQTRSGVRLLQNKKAIPSNSSSKLYPSVLARIEMDGYIRSQRVISLALHPVQYNAATRVLRSYTNLTVTIPFQTQLATRKTEVPAVANVRKLEESSLHEQTYAQHILNYAEYRKMFNGDLGTARTIRANSNMFPAAPAAPGRMDESLQTRYKLFIDETGIYQVTAASLCTDWGIDLIGVDPRKLRLKHGDQEIPIYVSGGADGRFDADDAIFFLAHSSTDPESPYAKNAYTLWNVYWLSLSTDGKPPARVPQIEASPSDATAVQVPTFRSRVIFEEDHLSNNLEFVYPDTVTAGDKHKWFDALDFWYWDGIKNASDIGELRLNFQLHDIAKSFDPPKVEVVLQGGTPVTHKILAAVNGVQVDLATWDRQAQVSISKSLRVNNLKDASQGETNVLSLTRIDDTYEEDTTRYPYHIYLNRFWVDYTRLFLAVHDQLRFGTPVPARQDSENQSVTHQFRVDAFLNPQISVFETDGNTLTAKLQGVQITRHSIDNAMRERFRALNSGDLRAVPNKTYSATFQVPDTRTTEFVAVSNTALFTPVRVETVPPSDLRNTLNGVDYLVLTHPRFREAAERLANWRATAGGGGYRTKVVDVNDVYNTFGDGNVHPLWIKDFLAYAYHNWAPPALSYLVILGDGTFDFRGIDKEIYPEPPELAGYIPPHYINTDSFGRTSVDHWYATVSGYDEFVDFYLGRLSVENEAEADAVVDKIINYESRTPNGAWRRRIVSVADDEVSNIGDHIFKKSLDEIAKDHTRLGYETVEIYLEDIIDEVDANPEKFINANGKGTLARHVAKDRIVNALGEGAAIAQYAGHGGRIVWTHESIFDNSAIDDVKETEHLPFMLVLSCYNGYFDKPGQPSMAEKLLRKERGGIIGMLSATRLTYGTGNENLNRIIFDMLFQRNIRQLGPLSFDSKLELLMTEGTGQLDVMLAYTLFGDPATQIAMADYEILPAIETKTVKPGDTLRISEGYIQTARYDAAAKRKVFTRNTNFDGKLTVKVVFPGQQAVGRDKTGARKEFYPGDVIVTETLSVQRGNFPAVEIDVPENIASGDAHLEYYAENATEIAVGGDSFSVGVPKILDIKLQLVTTPSGEDKIDISVLVSDDEKETVSVVLAWRNRENPNNDEVSLILAEITPESVTTARWWKLPKPLPVPTDGSAFRYDIQVMDADKLVVISDYYRFYPYAYPNLSVVSNRGENFGQIRYTVGEEDGLNERFLSVDIEVAGTVNSHEDSIPDNELLSVLGLSDVDVEVAFFSGNPDIDDNGIIDTDANLIGRTRIKPNNWVVRNPLYQRSNAYAPDPLNTNPIATVAIPTSLRTGIHDVFVYVDPTFSETDKPGKVLENNEHDNIGYKQVAVLGSIIGEVPTRVRSVDGGLQIITPAGVVQKKSSVLTVQPIISDTEGRDSEHFIGGTGEARNTTPNQPFSMIGSDLKDAMLRPVALPTRESLLGYALYLNDTESAATGNTFKLQAPVTVELDYDWTALQQQVIRELFGNEMDVSDEAPAIETTLNAAMEARVRHIGAYLWIDALANWTKLDSEIKRHSNGSIYTSVRATRMRNNNTGDGSINDVVIASEGANIGDWVVLFENARTYRLLFMPEESTEEPETSDNRRLKEIGREFPLISFNREDAPSFVGVQGFDLDFETGDTSFQFGDVLRFRITQLEVAGEESIQSYVSSFGNRNRGDGTIQYLDLSPETTIPKDNWLIMFVSPTAFQIEGKNSGVLAKDGEPIYGTVGKPFEHSDYGLNLLITHGPTPFDAGDRFLFETATVGTIEAKTLSLGQITCLQSEDTIPPEIQITIGNQQHFISGSSVDAAPIIQATLTDARGIDYITRPMELALGRFGEFEPIPETEYKLSQHPGSKQLVLTYNSPELEPREYQIRLTASDLDGNTGKSEITFQVHGKLQLVEPLNYPNPFTRDTTVTCELTRPAESLTVKIYTLTGRLIRQLKTEAPSGFIQLKWDGKDDDGNEVANGVYYGKMIVQSLDDEKDQTHILKMMKLK